MTDETTPVEAPVTPEPAPAEPQAAPEATTAAEPAPQAATPTWQEVLDKVDSKELRKHPKLAGILGSETQTAIQRERERIQHEEGEKAARAAEQRLRDLAQRDPVQFAEQWLTDQQRTDVQRQLNEMGAKARSDLAKRIGQAAAALPEWKELTQEDHEKLARALAGKGEDEVIPVFFSTVADLVTDRRAERRKEDWKAKELAKEREAIRQEERANAFKASDAPDGKAPKGTPAGTNIGAMSDKEFDEYWKKRYG